MLRIGSEEVVPVPAHQGEWFAAEERGPSAREQSDHQLPVAVKELLEATYVEEHITSHENGVLGDVAMEQQRLQWVRGGVESAHRRGWVSTHPSCRSSVRVDYLDPTIDKTKILIVL